MSFRCVRSNMLGLLAGVLSAAIAMPAQALDVSIDGLRNTDGDVVVCVWRAQDQGFPNCAKSAPFRKLSAPAAVGKVTIEGLPPGTYAVTMFHDAKRQGKPETNFMGMPTSAVGLANNPDVGPMNRPTFDKARVVVPDTPAITINAKYIF
ncbi:MAG: DUF2141 domain-containing protein [Filomicrobium sp.]